MWLNAILRLGLAGGALLTLFLILVAFWLPGPWHGGQRPRARDLLVKQLPWWGLLIAGVIALVW
jgi:hypothetical protein